MALSADAIALLPIHLAQKLGFYQQKNLSLVVSDVAGLSKGMERLLGGSADVAGATNMLAIQVAIEVRSVQRFWTLYSVPYYALVVRQILSPDGAMPDEGPDVVRTVIAASNAKARSALLDLSATYTNEFVTRP